MQNYTQTVTRGHDRTGEPRAARLTSFLAEAILTSFSPKQHWPLSITAYRKGSVATDSGVGQLPLQLIKCHPICTTLIWPAYHTSMTDMKSAFWLPYHNHRSNWKENFTLKHMKYIDIEISVMWLAILVLTCRLESYFHYSCEKWAVVCCANVTGARCECHHDAIS